MKRKVFPLIGKYHLVFSTWWRYWYDDDLLAFSFSHDCGNITISIRMHLHYPLVSWGKKKSTKEKSESQKRGSCLWWFWLGQDQSRWGCTQPNGNWMRNALRRDKFFHCSMQTKWLFVGGRRRRKASHDIMIKHFFWFLQLFQLFKGHDFCFEIQCLFSIKFDWKLQRKDTIYHIFFLLCVVGKWLPILFWRRQQRNKVESDGLLVIDSKGRCLADAPFCTQAKKNSARQKSG